MQRKVLHTDVLVIGGGTAGCFAAYSLGQDERAFLQVDRDGGRLDDAATPHRLNVLVVDKAAIKRSGCLAAGVNAINAYITRGRTPEYYTDYAMNDADGIARYDLLLSMSQRLNHVAKVLEDEGLVFLKGADGNYAERGTRNVRINGENIKPILARAARRQPNVSVLEHVNVTDLLAVDGRVYGAVGFGVRPQDGQPVAYQILARAVLVCTGGASGLYRPNNPGFSRHKMWYCPFDTGAGYAMGIRAGAEMTSFEMRFIALRCKDTIAPTGTIAQGVHAPQVNALGQVYEQKYGLRTSERVWGTVQEMRDGRGPCYLKTTGIGEEAQDDLYRAYLNMAPAQTLRWLEAGAGPDQHDVEIEGTEPYVVGGHTASGYWVDEHRRTTLTGLYAAGDVAGGAPQKYVTGALAEAEIASEAIAADWPQLRGDASQVAADATREPAAQVEVQAKPQAESQVEAQVEAVIRGYEAHLTTPAHGFDEEQVEEAMQKVMDQYAGGISCGYRYSEAQLDEARLQLEGLEPLVKALPAADPDELLRVYELRERLLVCRVLVEHLAARRETRWHSFAENTDYPQKDPAFLKYVNSRLVDGHVQIVYRDIVGRGEHLEHLD
ncbi:MAG: adenylyl-sulfate reductase subunit alpha [Atopobiaceae bacterium]